MGDLAARVEREVVELHRLFEDWLGRGQGDLARLQMALGQGFSMVGPQGRRLGRAEVVGWLAEARGARGADFRIKIEDVALIFSENAMVLANYVEKQRLETGPTARRSTVAFREDKTAPNGLVWLAVHETWI